MSHVQVFTPTLPYVGQLPGELRYGSRIKFRGHFREPQDTVHIILQREALLNPHEDLPLYITIHPGKKQIVRTHLCTGCSSEQEEERVDNCPIEGGQDFELSLVPSAGGFDVLLHGTLLRTFAYRAPLSAARYLFVSSGCVIFSINFENGNAITGDQPQVPTAPPLQLPRMYPTLEQHQPPPKQHQQLPRSPASHHHSHHQHGNHLRELVLQVLPLVHLAASQMQANANNANPTVGSNPVNASGIAHLAQLLPLFQPATTDRKKAPNARRTNRWNCLRINNSEIAPAMFLACSMGLMRLFRFLAIACVFGYIGYVFSRNVSPWK